MCVAKPDGSLRLCVDYRALNAVTHTESYPMPQIEELLDVVAPASYISTLDLAKVYYQVPLDESSIPKTAFSTPMGKFEFVRVPFSLKNAPSVFQRLMDTILLGMDSSKAYIDDVVTSTKTWEEHLQQLEQLFTKLSELGLTVKLSKCCFGRPLSHSLDTKWARARSNQC